MIREQNGNSTQIQLNYNHIHTSQSLINRNNDRKDKSGKNVVFLSTSTCNKY